METPMKTRPWTHDLRGRSYWYGSKARRRPSRASPAQPSRRPAPLRRPRPPSKAERQAPWAHRRPTRPRAVAGHDGKAAELRCIRQNGVEVWVPVVYEPQTAPAKQPLEKSMLVALRRRVSAELARYREQGDLSDLELWLIEELWQNGKSLRQVARELGEDPQLVWYWIERLPYRAVRFYQWWKLKHRNRSRR
jgi:hypothetical protein